jgi:hypothetical protein
MNSMSSIQYASLVTAGVVSIFATASTNFRLDSYGIGSGGTSGSNSSSYKVNGISGEASNTGAASATYQTNSGVNPTMQAHVPAAPTVTNPANYYNKLHIVINNGGNPSDATFAIAISTDSFATTQYIQNDTTIGSALGVEDYQTYAAWGGASGFDVIGLTANTTYYVKVKAEHGDFTESAYSPVASAATVSPSLTFDIDVSNTDTETSPPYATNFGSLLAGTVTDSPQRIWIDLETNGASGGTVFIASANAGLKSLLTTYTISALSGDLTSLNEGFGAQNVSASQSTGGPLTAQSPYTGASNNVGVTDTSLRQFYVSANPITAGRGSLVLKAKSKADTPAAADYTDTLTLIAAASF